MAKHPTNGDKDDDKDKADKAEEKRQEEERNKREEEQRRRQSGPPGDRSVTGERFVPPGAKPSTGNPLADSASGTLKAPGDNAFDDRQHPPRQPGPGNDRVVDTGHSPSGTGYPDGEPRQPVPQGTDVRTPAVSSPENPAVPRPPENTTFMQGKQEPVPTGDMVLSGVKKGDLVRLLVPHYDGFQLFAADSIVRWWNDDPPSARNAALPETEITPLNAPPMTDGRPPNDYIDPNTGRKPVIGSV